MFPKTVILSKKIITSESVSSDLRKDDVIHVRYRFTRPDGTIFAESHGSPPFYTKETSLNQTSIICNGFNDALSLMSAGECYLFRFTEESLISTGIHNSIKLDPDYLDVEIEILAISRRINEPITERLSRVLNTKNRAINFYKENNFFKAILLFYSVSRSLLSLHNDLKSIDLRNDCINERGKTQANIAQCWLGLCEPNQSIKELKEFFNISSEHEDILPKNIIRKAHYRRCLSYFLLNNSLMFFESIKEAKEFLINETITEFIELEKKFTDEKHSLFNSLKGKLLLEKNNNNSFLSKSIHNNNNNNKDSFYSDDEFEKTKTMPDENQKSFDKYNNNWDEIVSVKKEDYDEEDIILLSNDFEKNLELDEEKEKESEEEEKIYLLENVISETNIEKIHEQLLHNYLPRHAYNIETLKNFLCTNCSAITFFNYKLPENDVMKIFWHIVFTLIVEKRIIIHKCLNSEVSDVEISLNNFDIYDNDFIDKYQRSVSGGTKISVSPLDKLTPILSVNSIMSESILPSAKTVSLDRVLEKLSINQIHEILLLLFPPTTTYNISSVINFCSSGYPKLREIYTEYKTAESRRAAVEAILLALCENKLAFIYKIMNNKSPTKQKIWFSPKNSL